MSLDSSSYCHVTTLFAVSGAPAQVLVVVVAIAAVVVVTSIPLPRSMLSPQRLLSPRLLWFHCRVAVTSQASPVVIAVATIVGNVEVAVMMVAVGVGVGVGVVRCNALSSSLSHTSAVAEGSSRSHAEVAGSRAESLHDSEKTANTTAPNKAPGVPNRCLVVNAIPACHNIDNDVGVQDVHPCTLQATMTDDDALAATVLGGGDTADDDAAMTTNRRRCASGRLSDDDNSNTTIVATTTTRGGGEAGKGKAAWFW
ncbi:hypothetical protein EDB84DRAFT_1437436 [Lactarius hengduanensis]|nr:hypothetical protein EDB84DRAFT_1437436 [Lactarius hengduanensis]